MVSGRTLLAAGVAIVAIASLLTVVLVQQIALQNAARQTSSTTAYIIPPVSSAGPYVLVNYNGWTYSSWGSFTPNSGNVLLILWVVVENQGYPTVSTGPHAGFNQGYYFHLAADSQQFDPIYLSDLTDKLPMTDVLNGLSVSGYLPFEIPANFASISLLFQPETGTFNVQYNNLGTVAATTISSALSVTLTVSPLTGTTPFTPTWSYTYSGNQGAVTIVMNWGDGTTTDVTTCSNNCPSHTYTTAGTYTVRITVTDVTGATASDSKTITVAAS